MATKDERRWRRRRLTLLVAIVGVILVGVVFHRTWWREITNWRAERLLSESEEYSVQENWEEVERTARASLALSGSINGLRLLLRAQRALDRPNRLQVGMLLFQSRDATSADRTAVIAMALDARDLLFAAKLFRLLGTRAHENFDLEYEKVRFHLAMGEWNLALALADAGERTQGERCKLDLLLAEGLAKSGRISTREEVSRRLATVLDHSEHHLAVLQQLVALPDQWIPTILVERVSQELSDRSDLSEEDSFSLALLEAGLPTNNRAQIVQKMISTYRGSNLPKLVDWLRRLREWQAIVTLTNGLHYVNSRDVVVFGARADALAAIGEYALLEKELAAYPPGFPSALLFLSRAAIAHRQGKHAEAVIHWHEAVDKARRLRDTNHFYRFVAVAKQLGNVKWEWESLAHAIEHPLGSPPPAHQLEGLFAWLYQTGDIERLLAISYRLLLREPRNPILLNNVHYLHALHQKPLAESLAVLTELVNAFPEEHSFRGSLAFVQLRSGDPSAALATLEALNGNPNDLPVVEKAVYSAALRALRRNSEASQMAAHIDWTRLPDSERDALQKIGEP